VADRPFVTVGSGAAPVLKVESILADQTSAWYLANLIHARWGDDTTWDSPTVIVRHQLLSPAEQAAVAALEPGDELRTGGMAASPGQPATVEGRWRVEGWQETWDRGDGDGPILRTQQFAVSDAVRWRSDPGQLTRVTVSLVTPPPYVFPATPLTVWFNVEPADGQPPERPLQAPCVIRLDGRVVATVTFDDKPRTVILTEVIRPSLLPHVLTVDYAGPWGIWSDSSGSVEFTVDRLPTTPVLRIDPAGPVGVAPVLTITVRGLIAGDIHQFWVYTAEEGEPDVWTKTNWIVRTDRPVQLPAFNRPLLFKAVWTSGQTGYLMADSNVVGYGYSWSTVATNHPTWRDVADTRTSWLDVSRRG
jgi:hypothetical protein